MLSKVGPAHHPYDLFLIFFFLLLLPTFSSSVSAMESLSLSTVHSAPSPLQNHPKTSKPANLHRPHFAITAKLSPLNRSHSRHHRLPSKDPPLLSIAVLNSLFNGALPSPAAAAADALLSSSPEPSAKINLEAILVSIDDFFNRNPFFVAGCTFIWLVAIPVAEYYLKKYKYVSAIDAFRKLRDDPSAELLDIRDWKSLAAMASPNLRYVKKRAVQVSFDEGDKEGFVNKVKGSFGDPPNTVICILDNFDGNSMKAAELLFKNGFKEAYAIKDGVRGKRGWLAIQENLLPLSVHMYPKKKGKSTAELGTNGAVAMQNGRDNSGSSASDVPAKPESQASDSEDSVKSRVSTISDKAVRSSSSSPYPNYPDLKPPSSPTPSKPNH